MQLRGWSLSVPPPPPFSSGRLKENFIHEAVNDNAKHEASILCSKISFSRKIYIPSVL
jgi:hypothetical protein